MEKIIIPIKIILRKYFITKTWKQKTMMMFKNLYLAKLFYDSFLKQWFNVSHVLIHYFADEQMVKNKKIRTNASKHKWTSRLQFGTTRKPNASRKSNRYFSLSFTSF